LKARYLHITTAVVGPFESKVAYLYITVAVGPSGVACPKVWGGKMFDFRRITLFCLEKRLLKHKMTMFSKNFGGAWPLLPPPGYAYGWAPLKAGYFTHYS